MADDHPCYPDHWLRWILCLPQQPICSDGSNSERVRLSPDDEGAHRTDYNLGVFLYAIGKITHGILADFFGGRLLFLLGMGLSVVCTILFGMSTGFTLFCIAWGLNRYVQSMGWVDLVKTASRWHPVHRHATIMALLSLSFLVGDVVSRWYLGTFIEWGYD